MIGARRFTTAREKVKHTQTAGLLTSRACSQVFSLLTRDLVSYLLYLSYTQDQHDETQ